MIHLDKRFAGINIFLRSFLNRNEFTYNVRKNKDSHYLSFFCDKRDVYWKLHLFLQNDFKITDSKYVNITMWSEDWTYNMVFNLKDKT